MGFALKGEASAVGMLFERHPLETLPVRLEVLRCATMDALLLSLSPSSSSSSSLLMLAVVVVVVVVVFWLSYVCVGWWWRFALTF